MTARQKFWLKVVLTVTLPAWIIPFLALAFVGGILALLWVSVSDMVDQLTGPSE